MRIFVNGAKSVHPGHSVWNSHTVAAAGYRLGDLYQNLYETIVAFAPPEELDTRQVTLYNESTS